MAGITDSVKVFIAEAGRQQAVLFAACCVERAAGILFWAVSRQNRIGDLDVYSRTLEYIWMAGRVLDGAEVLASHDIEQMRELSVGDEATGIAASALYGAIAMRSALLYLETGNTEWAVDCSSVLERHAFLLGRRSSDPLVESEYTEQIADIEELAAHGVTFEDLSRNLRERARRVGRIRLEIAIRAYAG